MSAFSDELIFTIAKEKMFEVQLISKGSSGIESGLQHGDFDAIMSPLPNTPMNSEFYEFSEPYFFLGPVLIVHAESKIETLADMKDKRVGIDTGSWIIFDPIAYPAVILQRFENRSQALESLLKENIDGLIMNLIPAYSYSEGIYHGKFKIIELPITRVGLYLITNREDDSEIIDLFNDGLHSLKADGRYAEMLKKWDLYNPLE